ncbi:DeoR/GlpR family DNA-binding transcription regulator [Microbacterium sp. 18062]|uniref:DeoR/GlpR family DNA-binding transcription regulator n=1 Tax=Microbacterium sp. 18062 TaxID=2681410 RepID=UPI001F2E55AB|nr:DeoR/GlpR family DNA-binding transcription regulator [Microbacterium sp. 18062]
MAIVSTVSGELRRRMVLDLLDEHGRVLLDDLATRLGVSGMTVRRDLDELEAAGLLRRVRGGAVSVSRARPFAERMAADIDAKRTIARKAATLVPRTGYVAFDASSTIGVLLETIAPDSEHIAVTNSIDNFRHASARAPERSILVGGEAEASTGSLVGPLACRMASSLQYERFFASASAIETAWGTSEVTPREAQVKQVFAERAASTVLLATAGKLRDSGVARTLPWDDIDLVLTELPPEATELDGLRDVVELC